MKDIKHTPGPWRLDEQINAHVLDGAYHVIEAGAGYNGEGFYLSAYMSETDARLIAAAPDLAAALQSLLNGLIWHVETHPEIINECDHEAITEAAGALAKAGL